MSSVFHMCAWLLYICAHICKTSHVLRTKQLYIYIFVRCQRTNVNHCANEMNWSKKIALYFDYYYSIYFKILGVVIARLTYCRRRRRMCICFLFCMGEFCVMREQVEHNRIENCTSYVCGGCREEWVMYTTTSHLFIQSQCVRMSDIILCCLWNLVVYIYLCMYVVCMYCIYSAYVQQ